MTNRYSVVADPYKGFLIYRDGQYIIAEVYPAKDAYIIIDLLNKYGEQK